MLIGEAGEEALILKLRSLFAVTSRDVPVGIGDDAAVIDCPSGYQMVWTTDLLLQGVHFEAGWQTPVQLGRKSLAVNLSDIASMGAAPRYALLAIACPVDTELEFILGIAEGFCALAREEGVAVIGGDISAAADGILISVTAGGLSAEGSALLRSGARPGDVIMVTGFLGSAAGGLRLIQDSVKEDFLGLREAFVAPRAHVAEAQKALESGATAMTDLSDGLASDLRHICQESAVGARVETARLPVHPDLVTASENLGWDLAAMTLSGGEDYGLLFTVPEGDARRASDLVSEINNTPVTAIGRITEGRDILLVDREGSERIMEEHGYDHFRRNS